MLKVFDNHKKLQASLMGEPKPLGLAVQQVAGVVSAAAA